jgi:hypothetical protein
MHFGKKASTRRKCKGINKKLMLRPYSAGCPDGGTPHHLIPDRCTTGMAGYTHGSAPCVCVQGENQHTEEHRACHKIFDPVEKWHYKNKKDFKYGTAKNAAAKSAGGALDPARRLSKREQDCIKAQLDEYYTKKPKPGFTNDKNLHKSGGQGKVNELYDDVEAQSGKVVEVFG